MLSLPIATQFDVEALLWTPSPIVVVPAMPKKFIIGSGMHALIAASMRQRSYLERMFEDAEKLDWIRSKELTIVQGNL